jgi:cytochrome c-type biogenesis protein CcmF
MKSHNSAAASDANGQDTGLRELTSSMIRFTNAVTLFSMQQMQNALGIAGSMAYSLEREVTLGLHQSLTVGPYRIQFEGLKASEQPTHRRVEGAFHVYRDGNNEGVLNPALKFFPTQQSPIGRAVHQSTLTEDIYLILSGFSNLSDNQATLKVLVRPLVIWMWIGGFVILFGTLICILPMGKTSAQEQ